MRLPTRFFCLLFVLLLPLAPSWAQDSTSIAVSDSIRNDSVTTSVIQTPIPIIPVKISYQSILDSNTTLSQHLPSSFFISKERNIHSKEWLFYVLLGIFLYFGILKVIYSRYFSTVFRVFFNTSLRQSQLTDQLLQSKLQSLFFNLLFVIVTGCFLYVLAGYYQLIDIAVSYQYLWICIAAVLLVYLGKYLVLKFIGWLSGYKAETSSYIFIVFLINKIIGVFLLPVVLILAFSDKQVADIVVMVIYIIIVLMFLLRYIRSYSLLQTRLKLNRFHFLIYILATEFIPLLLLFKIAESLLIKYL